jgi:molybdopterin-containing oxidoreductase family membrane subunit
MSGITESFSYRFNRRADFTISLILGLIAIALGAGAVWNVVSGGDHGALGSYVPWGLWVSVYVYLVWMEVGMILGYYALKHVLNVKGIDRLGPVIVMAAICCLLSALMIIGMDLGHPFRAWRAFVFADFGSMMTWMIWLHTFYLLLLIVEFWAYHNDYEELIKWLNWVNIPAGIALIGVIGSLFGVIAARPYWNASMLPMAFTVSSLIAGTGLILLLHLLFSPQAGSEVYRQTAAELGRFLMWALVVGLVGAGANLLVTSYQNVPAKAEAMRLLLFGPYWWSVWIVHIGLGTLLPLALLLWGRNSSRALGAAALLLVGTFIMVPLNIIIPGLAYPSPELANIARAFVHERLSFDYFPSLTEWRVVLFGLGVALTLFALGYHLWLDRYYRRLARESGALPS